MIDRAARDTAAQLIEDFLNDRIGAFDFDEGLARIETQDELVPYITQLAWFYYDDNRDHLVRVDREVWNYFQRLLLILRSSTELEVTRRRKWGLLDLLVFAALLVIGIFAFYAEWNLVWLIAGTLSVVLFCPAIFREETVREGSPALLPFTTYGEIRRVREEVPSFCKQPYRVELDERLRKHESSRLTRFLDSNGSFVSRACHKALTLVLAAVFLFGLGPLALVLRLVFGKMYIEEKLVFPPARA